MEALGPIESQSWIMSNIPFLAAIGDLPRGQAYLAIDGIAVTDGASVRLQTLMMQVKAELASLMGDREIAEDALLRGVRYGLMDLNWLQHCPVLSLLRGGAAYEEAGRELEARAEKVIDAIWGGEGPTAPIETTLGPTDPR